MEVKKRARTEIKQLRIEQTNKKKDDRLLIRFLMYLGRWQLSGLVLAPVLLLFGVESVVMPTIIANLIGGIIFYWVDKRIFKKE